MVLSISDRSSKLHLSDLFLPTGGTREKEWKCSKILHGIKALSLGGGF